MEHKLKPIKWKSALTILYFFVLTWLENSLISPAQGGYSNHKATEPV